MHVKVFLFVGNINNINFIRILLNLDLYVRGKIYRTLFLNKCYFLMLDLKL
ncbi:hypothetical protein PGB90_007786 [Kerria lacca]